MVGTPRHDLHALFAFALRESDWPLASAIAVGLGRTEKSKGRLALEVLRESGRPGSPRSLSQLERWSSISRSIGLPD